MSFFTIFCWLVGNFICHAMPYLFLAPNSRHEYFCVVFSKHYSSMHEPLVFFDSGASFLLTKGSKIEVSTRGGRAREDALVVGVGVGVE